MSSTIASGFTERTWAYVSRRYQVVDLDFGIRSDDQAMGSFFDGLLSPFRVDGEPHHWYSFIAADGSEPKHAVYFDDDRRLLMTDRHLAGVFFWHLNQRVMLETRSTVAVHSGVVALDGQGVLIPGDADAGKSTLVAALVSAGFDYLSDEAALLDLEQPLVRPYPRALALEKGSWPLLSWLDPGPRCDDAYAPQDLWLLAPEDIRPGSLGTACRPRLIVFPHVTPGVPSDLRRISRSETVRRLARRATNLVEHGASGFRALVAAVESSSCWDLDLDGTAAAVGEVRSLLTKRGQ